MVLSHGAIAPPRKACDDAAIVRVAALLPYSFVVLALVAPEVLAQAGGGSSGFGGGGGGGSGSGGGGGSSDGDDDFGFFDLLIVIAFAFFFLGIPATIKRRRSSAHAISAMLA